MGTPTEETAKEASGAPPNRRSGGAREAWLSVSPGDRAEEEDGGESCTTSKKRLVWRAERGVWCMEAREVSRPETVSSAEVEAEGVKRNLRMLPI